MRIAHLAVGDRSFYLPPDEADQVLAAASSARESGTWLLLRDAGGRLVRVLIPSQALLVFEEYDIDDAERQPDANDWPSFDYDF